MPWDEAALEQVRGATVVADGDEVGSVDEVFAFAGADRPAVARVTTAGGSVLVPLGDGEADGDRVVVPYDAETVKAAPVSADDELTEDEFEAVYDHYGISDATQRDQSHP